MKTEIRWLNCKYYVWDVTRNHRMTEGFATKEAAEEWVARMQRVWGLVK